MQLATDDPSVRGFRGSSTGETSQDGQCRSSPSEVLTGVGVIPDAGVCRRLGGLYSA